MTARRSSIMYKMTILIGASLLLAACNSSRTLSGINNNSPDEFRVVSKPPLVIPPDFSVKPPRTGESSPQQLPASAQAIDALFPGRATLPPQPTAGENALVEALGADSISPNVRSMTTDSQTIVVEKGDLLQDVISMGERENAPDTSSIQHTGSNPVQDD